jgi:hypothetical protein
LSFDKKVTCTSSIGSPFSLKTLKVTFTLAGSLEQPATPSIRPKKPAAPAKSKQFKVVFPAIFLSLQKV